MRFVVLWNSRRKAAGWQAWLERLAYFSALSSMARLRINKSYFECSPRVILIPGHLGGKPV